jgi:hypothetical protein
MECKGEFGSAEENGSALNLVEAPGQWEIMLG